MDLHPVAKVNPLDPLPPALAERIRQDVGEAAVQFAAMYDLSPQGMYHEGCLVLAGARLGVYEPNAGVWAGEWLNAADFTEAKIVEGIGASMLRLLANDKLLREFRFTLRCAKPVAKLQRALERRIAGKADEADDAAEAPKPDEKKLRCDKCQRVIPPWAEYCPSCMSRRKVLSRLLDFVKPYKWRARIGFGLGLLVMCMGLVRPGLMKPMTDKGLGMATGARGDYDVLLIYIIASAALMVLALIADGVRQRLMAALGSKIGRDIRDATYTHLHKLAISFFSKKPTGSLVTRITSDSDRVWDFVAFTVIEIIISILTVVGVGVALFVINWRLACFVLIPVPIMAGLTIFFHKRIHHVFDRLFHRWSQMTAVVADALPGVRVIKAFSQEKREVDRFVAKNARYYEDEIKSVTLWTFFGPILNFCSQIGAILVWIIGGYWVIQDQSLPEAQQRVTPGDLIAFVSYMWMFYGPIHMLAHMDRMLNRAASSVQRIFEILDTEPVIFSKTGARQPDNLQGRIELRNVSFSYDGIRKVLKNVNLVIEPGQMIGLAGPSGGGKTTMINLICRFYDVLEGQILIDGVDLRDYQIEKLRRKVGLVLQEPFLFHGTVAENIAYGNPDATLDEIIDASRAANAHDFIVGFTDGYDTMVGERGQTLSGGERQRISIARAILNKPSILILDEATSSVDTETEKMIQEALDRLVADRTTIAIAHRLSTLRKADRLVVLEKGEIAEQGSHEELAGKDGGLYAKLLRMQTEMQSVIAIG